MGKKLDFRRHVRDNEVMTNRQLEDEAPKLARALHNTNKAYQGGFMSNATWKDHMSSLWGTAKHYGLLDEVKRLLAEKS